MLTVVLVVHLIIALTLVVLILLQRSEGGGLGIGGGGMSGFMSGRSTANLLTRTTGILAASFFVTSLVLAKMAGTTRAPTSIIDPPAPIEAPAQPQAPAPLLAR